MSETMTATRALEQVAKQNPKAVLVVSVDEKDQVNVSWSTMPFPNVCYLQRCAEHAIDEFMQRGKIAAPEGAREVRA